MKKYNVNEILKSLEGSEICTKEIINFQIKSINNQLLESAKLVYFVFYSDIINDYSFSALTLYGSVNEIIELFEDMGGDKPLIMFDNTLQCIYINKEAVEI